MQTFIEEENSKSQLFARRVVNLSHSDNEPVLLEIGIHPVMFGWRVRGGIVDPRKGYAELYCFDLCAGADHRHISLIYTTSVNLIARNLKKLENQSDCLHISRIFPVFDVKPIINDTSFPRFLEGNIGGTEEIRITAEDLITWREEFFTQFL